MLLQSIFITFFILFGNLTDAQAQTQPIHDMTRGESLYTTHCIACHSTQPHWRDKRIAKDWTGLRTEVGHWQKLSAPDWTDDDIMAVTRYLNIIYYHYPTTE